MGENSGIQWTNHTWNPWQGCIKVSKGCKFCYMYRDMKRWAKNPMHVVRSAVATFRKPLQWKEPAYVFLASWSDFFIEEADAWRDEAWAIIRDTPHLTYQILTKRSHRVAQCLPKDWGTGYPNVWIGFSIEDQEAWDERHVHMQTFMAVQKFFSFEPLLGHINIEGRAPKNIWAIIGGESGHETGEYQYRICTITWMFELMRQCKRLGWTVFIKQTGTHIAKHENYRDGHGGDPEEWPEYMRVREMPTQIAV